MHNRKFYYGFSLYGLPLFLYYNWPTTWSTSQYYNHVNLILSSHGFSSLYDICISSGFPINCVECVWGAWCWPYFHHILVSAPHSFLYGVSVAVRSAWFIPGWKLMAHITIPSLPALTCKLPATPTFVPITSILGHTA